jgi:hypothetical protein
LTVYTNATFYSFVTTVILFCTSCDIFSSVFEALN